ncbi:hypothetical protein EVA_05615, partial [gut metagenome]
ASDAASPFALKTLSLILIGLE